jgi:hypothetical protein
MPKADSVHSTPPANTAKSTGELPEYPPEIFGKRPGGFILEEQPIEMLCFWHQKANVVIDELPNEGNYQAIDERLSVFCNIKHRILAAILAAPASRAGQVAAKLRAVVAEMEAIDADSVEEVLDGDDVVKISAELTTATAPIVPKKRIGALQRGGKLTRAGLLQRYQTFLVQELETVSWNLHGERDYAKHVVFYDDAVGERCLSKDRSDPFFDERRLTTRARAVLASLDIDHQNAGRLG